jgi:hypothetical protein
MTLGMGGLQSLPAQTISPEIQSKIDLVVDDVMDWASSPVLIKAVKARNAAPDVRSRNLTEEKWAALSIIDPFVCSFASNEAGLFLKSKKTFEISEAFLNAADGTKIAFLSKPTYWCHKGKPKHDVPMMGRVWKGSLELDESTGMQQMQVAAPILDNGKPIGSLVVGIVVSKL